MKTFYITREEWFASLSLYRIYQRMNMKEKLATLCIIGNKLYKVFIEEDIIKFDWKQVKPSAIIFITNQMDQILEYY